MRDDKPFIANWELHSKCIADSITANIAATLLSLRLFFEEHVVGYQVDNPEPGVAYYEVIFRGQWQLFPLKQKELGDVVHIAIKGLLFVDTAEGGIASGDAKLAAHGASEAMRHYYELMPKAISNKSAAEVFLSNQSVNINLKKQASSRKVDVPKEILILMGEYIENGKSEEQSVKGAKQVYEKNTGHKAPDASLKTYTRRYAEFKEQADKTGQG